MNTTMSQTKHPGTITFVEGTTETVEQASTVPESIRFAPDKDGVLTPVVRVVATVSGNQREIKEYGPDGALLRSTIQLKTRS